METSPDWVMARGHPQAREGATATTVRDQEAGRLRRRWPELRQGFAAGFEEKFFVFGETIGAIKRDLSSLPRTRPVRKIRPRPERPADAPSAATRAGSEPARFRPLGMQTARCAANGLFASTADLKSLHRKRLVRPGTSDRQSGTRLNKFASAHDFPKFVTVVAAIEHELRKVGTSGPIPAFASLPAGTLRMLDWTTSAAPRRSE
jgi:hypothetical protein